MKLFRYAVLAIAATLTAGCASPGGKYTSKNTADHSNDVWERVRKGFRMPDLQDSRVEYWTNYYASRPQSVQIMAERSRKYIYHITKELEKRNMPTELALLPFVESAYIATAQSRVKAAGLWQFMPATGTHYNLQQDWWSDNRLDPVNSTRAALDYLSYLYNFQGNDWALALASYNWGEGSVLRARERNQRAGLGTDYLSLRMPEETRNYVPKLQAMENIIRNPSKYGIVLPNIPDQPYFVEVPKTKDIDINVVVKLAGISLQEFKELNPAPKRSVLLAQHRSRILLPKNKVDQYKKNLSSYTGELSAWAGYDPQIGESLETIAQRFGISLDKLKSLNGYTTKQKAVVSNRTLMVPRTQGLSPNASADGIDTRGIPNTVAGSSALLASNQVNLPGQINPIRQVNPDVRLGVVSAVEPNMRLGESSRSAVPALASQLNNPVDQIGQQIASNTTVPVVGAIVPSMPNAPMPVPTLSATDVVNPVDAPMLANESVDAADPVAQTGHPALASAIPSHLSAQYLVDNPYAANPDQAESAKALKANDPTVGLVSSAAVAAVAREATEPPAPKTAYSQTKPRLVSAANTSQTKARTAAYRPNTRSKAGVRTASYQSNSKQAKTNGTNAKTTAKTNAKTPSTNNRSKAGSASAKSNPKARTTKVSAKTSPKTVLSKNAVPKANSKTMPKTNAKSSKNKTVVAKTSSKKTSSKKTKK